MKKKSSRKRGAANRSCAGPAGSVPFVRLPEYEQAEAHWFSGESDALAALVYNWSPTGLDETAWREKVHAALDHAYTEGRLSVTREVPTSWLDGLLTGPSAVVGEPPYDCRHIEKLLTAIRTRMSGAPNT